MRIENGEIIYEGAGWRITISPAKERQEEITQRAEEGLIPPL